MARESFLVYGSWQEPIARLSNESKGLLFYALLEYHNSGREIDLPIDAQMAFLFMKKQMDLDADKYLATCEKRAAAGRKGGQKSKSKQNKQMLDLVSKKSKSKQSQANQADKEKDKEKENDVCDTHRAPAREDDHTHKMIEQVKARLRNKFYVPQKTDAECMEALRFMRTQPNDVVVAAAQGAPVDVMIDGKEIWHTGSRELDMAAGRRVWDERLLVKYQNGGNDE